MFMRRLKIILQHKYLFKVLALLVLMISLYQINFIKRESILNGDLTSFEGIVKRISIKDNRVEIYVNNKETIIGNYYYEDVKEISNFNDIKLGDRIIVYGNLKKANNNTIPNLFNYKKYLSTNGIFYLMTIDKFEKVGNNTSIIYYIKNKLIGRINNIKKSGSYVKTFVLAINEIDKDVRSSYQYNGISHLFSISGMHITLFATFLLGTMNKISYNRYFNYFIVNLFLIFFMALVGFTVSSVRSVLMFILFSINKLFNLKIKSLDIMLMVLIILLLINPFYLYSVSFLFSYIISTGIVMANRNIKIIKKKLAKNLYISFICFTFSLPICINYFNQVNVLSFVLNLFFIPLVSNIIFPLSIVCLFVPKIDTILYLFIGIMEKCSLFVSNISMFVISFPKVGIVLVIIYYVILVVSLYKPKMYIVVMLLIILFKNISYFDSDLRVLVFDVGQGDSILVSFPNNGGNVLIDTSGDTMNYESSNNVGNKIIPYLKTVGITKIDYLVVSHGDFDHMGEAINLVNNFKVDNVVFNCGEYNNLEKNLIMVLNKKNIKYYTCIRELRISKYKMQFLNTREYDNENDNSSVVYFNYDGYKFLFMGDAGVEKEKDILEKYNISDIDVLKVGHHGSKTSSDKKFIDEIKPKYSIISVGKNNRYGHPNKEVLYTLNDSKIYRTDQDGSIMFKIKNDKLQIETCSP
mgnify:FL=1